VASESAPRAMTHRIEVILLGGLARGPATRLKRPLLAALVFMLDRWLQRLQGIFEYTHKPDCFFRISFNRLRTGVVLSDGTVGRPGDRVVELHLWNERIPVVPAKGPSLAWGRQFNRCFAESLRELAQFLMSEPELRNITIVRANMSVGSKAQSDSLYGIVSRHGFEVFPDDVGLSLPVHVRRFGENILYWLLTLVCNPAAARSNKFWRTRSWIYLSRKVLERKYITAGERAFDSGQTRTGDEHASHGGLMLSARLTTNGHGEHCRN
jgi:YkoP domain